MDEESKTLLKIIRNNPQLFLDEIQIMMLWWCHKKWHYTTIWRQMKRLGYSLNVAVFVARQRNNKAEQERYKARLASAVGANPKQLIYIDKTHKSANASWRRKRTCMKGWGLHTPDPWSSVALQKKSFWPRDTIWRKGGHTFVSWPPFRWVQSNYKKRCRKQSYLWVDVWNSDAATFIGSRAPGVIEGWAGWW
jgi:hypothetical protein